MADINRNSPFWNEGPNPVPVNRLAEYFRQSLTGQRPEVACRLDESFEGLKPPIGQAFRLSTGETPVPLSLPVEVPHTPQPIRPPSESLRSFWESYGETTQARPGQRQPLTEEDLRIHAWLNERLAVLHYERYGLWPRGNRLLRAIARFRLWPFGCKERFNSD